MVVPLPPTSAQGEASEDLLRMMRPAKYCTIGLWVLVPIRLILDGLFNCLAVLFSALCCTYLLMNDPSMASCYSCLFNSPLGACGPGGLQCLLPAIFICVINCLFDGIRFFSTISITVHLAKLGFVVPMLLELSLLLSFVLQGVIGWVAYKVFKQISSSAGDASQPFLGGDPYAIGQPPAGPVSYRTTFGAPTGGQVNQISGGVIGASRNNRGFVPFGGSGRQLGGE
ncbi:hypothetical protein Pmar_PMAR029531 [Perkinsus marinus ATCC 50983]|uniref:Uncharacterized protein n=1 Tax=Perkinsus marinus (strain ATCC 50983 / TXsc) TaxID=423536 RepID=C5LD24_PERM5|nr:hypothetical protein Pmar_PMAR029531 [Perkinsus marinus ATCC 50983]EER05368.1 hypothetical protein Pmar_PMAR029531 [Perkinsus marinus ATCC 50983]|eukprot:XP_002773552.1 hypothetical protein Pmar_PMAR029531 [Perkinsus marinus ATCC 50983]